MVQTDTQKRLSTDRRFFGEKQEKYRQKAAVEAFFACAIFQLAVFGACSAEVDKSSSEMYHKTRYFAKYHSVLHLNGILLLGEVRSCLEK